MSKKVLLRLIGALLMVLAVGLAIAGAARAEPPPSSSTSRSVKDRRQSRQDLCQVQGGASTAVDDKSSAGNLVASTVSCSGGSEGDWTCTESLTQSVCTSAFTITPSAIGPRAPVTAGVNGGPVTAGQPTPTPASESTFGTLEQRTRAEMADCTRKLGTPMRLDYTSGDQVVATVVQCTGGALNGTMCFNAGSVSRCKQANEQFPTKPILNGPNGNPARPQASPRPVRLIPVATPAGTLKSGG